MVIKRDIELRTERPCSIARVMALEDGFELDTLKSISEDVRPTMVVYSIEASENHELIHFLREVHASGVRVRDVATFYDSFVGKVPLRELESSALLFDVGEVHHPAYFRISRGFDVIFGLVGLVALALVIPLVFIGNLLGNRGPILYDQQRIGKGGFPFRIYKFRSMMPGGTSTDWTTTDDPRITRFGRLLRKTHLDELPQVFNILKGDLSLIGPRPEQPRYVEALSETIPFYGSRHLVRPGLTGWAQVNYPYGADEIDAYEKLQYDFWYLKHQRVLIDLKIIARTVRHVLGFRGR
jgi:lipopolysaccharide/colanic/teichoic acid biosynthesis glycosyltransferase